MKKRKELDYRRFDQMADNQSTLIQLLNGMQEIKLHNAEKQKRWKWERIQAKLFRISVGYLKLEQIQSVGANFINELKNIFITFIAARAVIQGDMTLGMMMAVQYIIGQLNGPISQWINFIKSYQDAEISLERLNEIHLKEEEEDLDESYNQRRAVREAKSTIKPKGVGIGNGPGKTEYKKVAGGFNEKRKEGPKSVGTGKAKFTYKDGENLDGEFKINPKKKVEANEASRTLGAGKRFGKNSLDKPKAAPRHLRKESVDGELNLLREKNNEYRNALNVFRDKLNEVAVFNSNLAYATRLFTEHSTTKNEKINILRRFDSVESLKESKSLYKIIKDNDVRCPEPNPLANQLSGGNLQKFMVGRELIQSPELLIVAQPTWGVDAGSANNIHQALIALADQGSAILIISQDLDEILTLCEQIHVLSEGSLSSAVDMKEDGLEKISQLMVGSES